MSAAAAARFAASPGARAVMCLGTGSNAGKSVLAAALCRIHARRGFTVAPFKAQNMALKSFETPGGGERGRAQAYQACAAGVEPHVDMNSECHAYQAEVWRTVTAAYERLCAANDLIVID